MGIKDNFYITVYDISRCIYSVSIIFEYVCYCYRTIKRKKPNLKYVSSLPKEKGFRL